MPGDLTARYFLPDDKSKPDSVQDLWEKACEYSYRYEYYPDEDDMFVNASPYYKLPELYEEQHIGFTIKPQAFMEDVMQLRHANAGNLATKLKLYLQESSATIELFDG